MSNKLSTPSIIQAVSFPKSGRTWIELIVARIYANLSGRRIEKVLKARRGRRERISHELGIPVFRFGHGHHNPQIAQGLFPHDYYAGKPVFLLVRDPRDVVVSHYYHCRYRSGEFEGSLKQFIHYNPSDAKSVRHLRNGLLPIIRYMNAWIEHRDTFSKFHLSFYEDMKRDPKEEVARIFRAYDIRTDRGLIEDAIDFGSMENMKSLEQENAIDWKPLLRGESPEGNKVRTGRVGGFREEMDREDREFAKEVIATHLNPAFARYLHPDDQGPSEEAMRSPSYPSAPIALPMVSPSRSTGGIDLMAGERPGMVFHPEGNR